MVPRVLPNLVNLCHLGVREATFKMSDRSYRQIKICGDTRDDLNASFFHISFAVSSGPDFRKAFKEKSLCIVIK